MKLHLLQGRRYSEMEKNKTKAHSFFISLSVSGCEYCRVYDLSGKKVGDGGDNVLGINFPGFLVDFSYNSQRENYVLACHVDGVYFDNDMGCPVMEHNNMKIPLVKGRVLPREQTLALRAVFERIIELMDSPLPGNIFMAEQLAISLIGELAVKDEKNFNIENPDSPAKDLKQLIDNDIHFAVPLKEFCRKVGYSPSHLRKMFLRQFGIDPGEYRLRKKQEKVFLLMRAGNMTLKEIAFEVGMKNVTHLNGFIRKRCLTTPRELRRRLRENLIFVESFLH